jgi:DNA repair exonuclease SbcCD nuclease subunit
MAIRYTVTGERNPIIEFPDYKIKVQTIGDPHCGRVFKTGVLSSNLGIREKSVLQTFKTLLNPDCNLNITHIVIVGDLFDKSVVTPTVKLEVFNILKNSAELNTNINYYLISGNHDLSKDISKKSSYELLTLMLDTLNLSNLKTTTNNPIYELIDDTIKIPFYFYFDCYNPFGDSKFRQSAVLPTAEMVSFGHWDVVSSEKTWAPSSELISCTSLFVSGHEHTPFQNEVYNTDYICTGSMQPYTHAEDSTSEFYITIDIDKLSEIDVSTLKNKNVRLLVDKNYVLAEPIQCLALTFKLKELEPSSTTPSQTTVVSNVVDFNSCFYKNILEAKVLNEAELNCLKTIITDKVYLNVD